MYNTTVGFHKRISRGEVPDVYIIVHTDMGYRAWGQRELKMAFDEEGHIADGSWIADGSVTAGSSLGLLEASGRLLGISGNERTIQPKRKDFLTAYGQKQKQHLAVTLDNADHHFSKLVAKEPLLSKPLTKYVGFQDDPIGEHLQRFDGTITEVKIDGTTAIIEADER